MRSEIQARVRSWRSWVAEEEAEACGTGTVSTESRMSEMFIVAVFESVACDG